MVLGMPGSKTGANREFDRYTLGGSIRYAAFVMDFQDDESQAALRERLEELRLEHRDLDEVIAHLVDDPCLDQIRLSRMKKRKLLLKDIIAKIESQLIPDLKA